MARIRGRKDSGDSGDSNEGEVSDLVSESFDTNVDPEEDEFGDLYNSTVENDDNENNTEEEETPEMSAVEMSTTDETVSESEINPTEADEMESALSDAAKEIADKATGHTVEMLSVDSIPPTAFVVQMNLKTLDVVADQIKKATEEFIVGTSGKDEKVKHAIANLSEENDPENFSLAKSVEDAKRQIEELEDLIERNETQLYANVEERLTQQGDAIWSDETIEEKKKQITEQYSAYLKMHGATKEFVDAHRSHTPADNLGTIDQYHIKLSKPFAKSASKSSGTRSSSGAPRNVSVKDARVSYDNGATWKRVEGQMVKPDGPILSNPMFLSAEIARLSSENGNEIKSRLYSEWYASAGFPDRVPSSEEMQEVTEFPFAYKAKDGSEATALIRLTKKTAAIDA